MPRCLSLIAVLLVSLGCGKPPASTQAEPKADPPPPATKPALALPAAPTKPVIAEPSAVAKVEAARLQIAVLENACRHYMVKNDGNAPGSLRMLVAPTDGSRPLILGGLEVLTDSWGKPYQLDTDHVDTYGMPDPLVFTLDPGDGKKITSARRKNP